MKIEILTEDDILKIDKAAKAILCRTGVLVPHEQTLKLFQESGADPHIITSYKRLRLHSLSQYIFLNGTDSCADGYSKSMHPCEKTEYQQQ